MNKIFSSAAKALEGITRAIFTRVAIHPLTSDSSQSTARGPSWSGM
ncbi:MAG: hypothetical protein ABIN37_04255 [Burkholderiaceae bacterium]